MVLTVAAEEIQTRTYLHYEVFEKLSPSSSNGSSDTLQLYVETLDQKSPSK